MPALEYGLQNVGKRYIASKSILIYLQLSLRVEYQKERNLKILGFLFFVISTLRKPVYLLDFG